MERTGGEVEKKTDQLIKEQTARKPLSAGCRSHRPDPNNPSAQPPSNARRR
jgi:hypothetical protein